MSEDKLFTLTRQLVDIDSTTGREGPATRFLAAELPRLMPPSLHLELWEVEPERWNLFAWSGAPRVVLSTHLDTVPPFFPSREDATNIYGRGACDAKGIAAAQIFALRNYLRAGGSDAGLLLLVGEERNSAGALAANLRPPALPPGVSRSLVNGEPTGNRLIIAGKGVLRLNLCAQGRAAHSAYPELGDSAIDKLLESIQRIRQLPLPSHPQLGPTTLNVGTIRGGRAPNVIADEAEAELMFRLVADSADLRQQILAAVGDRARVEWVLELPPIAPRTLPGFATDTVAFGTDIPNLTAWGQPLLYGPGSIHVAHTPGEFIAKSDLTQAVAGYERMLAAL